MIEKIRHWFGCEPKEIDWRMRMKMVMYRHRHLRFIKEERLFEVNQNLTALLLAEEEVFLKEFTDADDVTVKRHRLVAQQLEELRNLRQEIKEVYSALE